MDQGSEASRVEETAGDVVAQISEPSGGPPQVFHQPDNSRVMVPFHVVALVGAKLDECRQRLRQETPSSTLDCEEPVKRQRAMNCLLKQFPASIVT